MCRGVVVGPIASKLSDKCGCRAVTMTGGLMMCISLALCSLATRLFHVYLALGIGVGMKLFYAAFSQLLPRDVTPR